MPEIENNISLLEALLEEAQALGIAIYENEDDVVDLSLGDNGEVDEDGHDGRRSGRGVRPFVSRVHSHEAPLFDLSNVPIDDSVGLYFREMGQQGLLSAEEEVQLAMEIEAGRAASERMTSGEIVDLDELDRLNWSTKLVRRRGRT